MELFLSHITALTFWRTASAYQAESALPVEALPSNDTAHTARAAFLAAEGTGFHDAPLHVMTPAKSSAHAAQGITFHESRLLKPGMFRKLGKDLYIASPELTFAQAARFLSLPELVFFGNELCAEYVRDSFIDEGFTSRPAVSNLKSLNHTLKRLGPFDGKRKAYAALRFVEPNTASPAESELAAHLALPKMHGGAGFTGFECNKELVIPAALKHLSHQRTVKPDICWSAQKVAIEYESNDFHTGAERITRDSVRRNTLIAMGYNVICITRGQTRRFSDLLIEDQKIARALGIRWRPRDARYEIKAQQCWHTLEHWNYSDPKKLSLELEDRLL